MVGLLATDVRDKLFLGEELRRRMPDVQFFTYESNVLYLRSDKNLALRGMLVFSTYPLILDNQWFTGDARQNQRFAFSSDGMQGTYNATLIQLGFTKAVLDYRTTRKYPEDRDSTARDTLPRDPLFRTKLRPPVWLTTVGNKTFLPLRIDPVSDTSYLAPPCKEPDQCPQVSKKYPGLNLPFLPLARSFSLASHCSPWRSEHQARHAPPFGSEAGRQLRSPGPAGSVS